MVRFIYKLITLEEKEEGAQLEQMVEFLREKLSNLEKEQTDMAADYNLKMTKMHEQNQAELKEQEFKFQTQIDQFKINLKEKDEQIKKFQETIDEKEQEIIKSHDQTKKLQIQLEQKEQLAKWEKVIAEREEKTAKVKTEVIAEREEKTAKVKTDTNIADEKPATTAVQSSSPAASHSAFSGKFGPLSPKMATYDGKNDWHPTTCNSPLLLISTSGMRSKDYLN